MQRSRIIKQQGGIMKNRGESSENRCTTKKQCKLIQRKSLQRLTSKLLSLLMAYNTFKPSRVLLMNWTFKTPFEVFAELTGEDYFLNGSVVLMG